MASNLKEVIQSNERPNWYHRDIVDMTQFWKEHWAMPHASKDKTYQEFSKEEFIKQTLKDFKKYKNLCKNI